VQDPSDELRRSRERRLLDSIARLANVDGALVVNAAKPVEQIHCFGAKITCSADDHVLVHRMEFPAYDVTLVDLSELGGTRHRSSATYAWHHPGALVLAVSQDGTSSVFIRHAGDEAVNVYRGFEASFPLDGATLNTASMVWLRSGP
jgi:hypothetical protein